MNAMINKRFGKLTVVSECVGTGPRLWECRCDCGEQIQKITADLNRGRGLQCRKCSLAMLKDRASRQGKLNASPYPKKLRKVYDSMRRRCYKPHDTFYRYYGGRGIRICDEWLSDLEAFCKWALSSGYSDGLSIDRIDSNGNYEPSNCRWTTKQVQSENRRSTINLTWNGKTQSITAWARELNVKKGSLWYRFKSGWDVARIFSEPFPQCN